MVELELLQRRERPVAGLSELETPPLQLTRLVERVALRRRLAQIGQGDEHDTARREERAEEEREVHRATGASAPL